MSFQTQETQENIYIYHSFQKEHHRLYDPVSQIRRNFFVIFTLTLENHQDIYGILKRNLHLFVFQVPLDSQGHTVPNFKALIKRFF